jgi:hypothetical protein
MRNRDRRRKSGGKWSEARRDDLAEDLDILLGDLCRNWGFCLPIGGKELLSPDGSIDAPGFAQGVLMAEGFNPDLEAAGWRTTFERLFKDRYDEATSRSTFVSGVR